MTTMTPTKEHLEQYVTSQVIPQARNTLRAYNFARLEEDSITLFRPQETITKLPDGTVQASQAILARPLQDHSGSGIFRTSWYALKEIARQEIQQYLDRFFGTTKPDGHTPQGPPEALWAYNNTDLQPHTSRAIRQVMASTGHGYVTNPQAVGTHLLQQLLGKDMIVLTLTLSGKLATIADYNTTIRNLDSLTRTRDIDPNALTLWYRTHAPGMPADERPNPDQVLQQARQAFQAAAARCHQHNPIFLNPLDQDPQLLWQSFGRLNHAALDRAGPETQAHRYVTAASIALSANASPSHTVTRLLLTHELQQEPGHTALLTALSAESRRQADNRRLGTQREIIHQYYSILHDGSDEQDNRPGQPRRPGVLQPLADQDTRPPMPWRAILALFPAAASSKPPQLYANSRAPAKSPPATWATRQSHIRDMEQTVLQAARETLPTLLQDPASVTTAPDTVVLKPGNHRDPITTLIRLDDGTLLITEDSWGPGTTLPDPEGHDVAPPLLPTTMDTAASAGADLIRQHLESNRHLLPPGARLPTTHNTVRHLQAVRTQLDHQTQRHLDDTRLTHQWRRAIAALLDPPTWAFAHRMNGAVTLQAYNRAATLPPAARELADTNPGAAAWLFHNQDAPHQNANHPGQLVSLLRQHTRQAGVPKSCWKTLSQLPPLVVAALPKHPHNLAPVLMAIARHGAVPSPDTLDLVDQAFLQPHPDTWYQPHPDNLVSAMDIIFQHDARKSPDEHLRSYELRDTADYTAHQTRTMQPIRATTWNGLLRATRDWHRHLDETRQQRDWEDRLKITGGWYHAWDSLVPQRQDGDLTVVPLTNALMLHQEAVSMHHCVHGYADACAGGESRIFSIRDSAGAPVATTELQRPHGQWTPVQTRGPYNHDTSPQAHSAADRLAQAYNAAQHRVPSHTGNAWKINAHTGQPHQGPLQLPPGRTDDALPF